MTEIRSVTTGGRVALGVIVRDMILAPSGRDVGLVGPGGRVPANGVVVEGNAELGESTVTGEAGGQRAQAEAR